MVAAAPIIGAVVGSFVSAKLSKPKTSALTAPTPDQAEDEAGEAAEKKRKAIIRDRVPSILTSGQGLAGQGDTKTILGG